MINFKNKNSQELNRKCRNQETLQGAGNLNQGPDQKTNNNYRMRMNMIKLSKVKASDMNNKMNRNYKKRNNYTKMTPSSRVIKIYLIKKIPILIIFMPITTNN